MIYLIVAHDDKGGIGRDGSIPWKSPVDMKHFKQITSTPGKTNALIMGSVTCDGLIMSRFGGNREIIRVGKKGYPSVKSAIESCNADKIFICGGQRVYEEALSLGMNMTIYESHIAGDYHCDRFISIPQCTAECVIHSDDMLEIKMKLLLFNDHEA